MVFGSFPIFLNDWIDLQWSGVEYGLDWEYLYWVIFEWVLGIVAVSVTVAACSSPTSGKAETTQA
jgi:hypothetical protein